MAKNKKHGKLTYGIIGLGRFGFALAKDLAQSGADVIALDKNEEIISAIRDYTDNAYIVPGLDKKTLIETGLEECDVAVVCIGENIDVSILTTLHLVSLGIPRVIAKAVSEDHGVILEKIGAEIVFPERDMGIRLANRLEMASALDIVQLSEKINVSKIKLPDSAVDKSVIEVDLRGKLGLNIIAIENDGNVTDSVRPDYVFKKGDILYLSGSKESTEKLNNWTEE